MKLVFFLLFLAGVSYASVIDVQVSESLNGEITYINYNVSQNLADFNLEFFNSGSLSYKTRIRLDIFSENKRVFTAWSKELPFFPGNKKNFRIYWHNNATGNFTIVPRVYFANEILQLENITVSISERSASEDIFEISNVKIYENQVAFSVKAGKKADNIIAMPVSYVPGWIFEQQPLGSLDAGEEMYVELFYEPTLWSGRDFKIGIVSDSGKYYTEKNFRMEKQKDTKALVRHILLSYFLYKLG